MKNTKGFIKYFFSKLLPVGFSILLTAFIASKPDIFSWLNPCKSGNQICNTVFLVVTVIIILFICIFLSGLLLDLGAKVFWGRNNLLTKFINWTKRPRIRCWFELISKNDMRLHVYNPRGAKEIEVLYTNLGLRTLAKEHYRDEHLELKAVRDSHSNFEPLLQGVLKPNDEIVIQVGTDFNGKIALRYMTGDSPVTGFRDGTFEYVVLCNGFYFDKQFILPEYSIWLVIKDGALIKIKKKL